MERRDDKLSSRKPLADNLNYKIAEDARSLADTKPMATANGKEYVPINEINNKNVQEYMSSLEEAQKKWVENAKSWPVEDEIQNAQLQWLNEISVSGPKFLCTSTPQPKKKAATYTLPWSPPKSSADINPRRGVCIYYKPTTKPRETQEYVDEKGYTVKVARLEEEHSKAPISKRPDDHKSSMSIDGRSNHPAHSSEKDLIPPRKTPAKRYITVRKKLERLKKPKSLDVKAEEDGRKSSTSPEMKIDEKREAAREYILKKRAERERLLEEERKLEAKALEEKKARMERLRETQLRLIKNSIKKPLEVACELNKLLNERRLAGRIQKNSKCE